MSVWPPEPRLKCQENVSFIFSLIVTVLCNPSMAWDLPQGMGEPHACPGTGLLLSYLGSCDLQIAYLCVTHLSWLAKGQNPRSATISCVSLGKLFNLSQPECIHL